MKRFSLALLLLSTLALPFGSALAAERRAGGAAVAAAGCACTDCSCKECKCKPAQAKCKCEASCCGAAVECGCSHR